MPCWLDELTLPESWDDLRGPDGDRQRADGLEEELRKELRWLHPLRGHSLRVVAAYVPSDDVLVAVDESRAAIVHLTWKSGKERLPWPLHAFFDSVEALDAELAAREPESTADLTSRPPARGHTVGPVRRAWLVWGVALAAYLLAIFHRSSLAVAGLAAADRFDISAAQLATFTMLQLLVYAGMQIPVGLLVDRYGPRSVMLTGRDRADARAGRFRPGGVVRRGAGRARLRRHGRRDDVDLPAPARGRAGSPAGGSRC